MAHSEEEKYIQGLVGKPAGKRPLGRTKRGLQDIKMDLKSYMTGGGVNWINLAQNRETFQSFVNMVMNIGVQ